MPKYEKVDAHTIKVIIEKAEDVPITRLLENKKQFLGEKARIERVLKNIDEMLAEAKKLGITPKPKDANPEENK